MVKHKAAVALCVLLLITLISHKHVSAQSNAANAESEPSKLELGIQFSSLRQGNIPLAGNTTNIGGGFRLTYNFNKYIALEGELNYFPSTGIDNLRKAQGQFGVKSGFRFKRFGVFGKARPGFIYANRELFVSCFPVSIPPGTTFFAISSCSLFADPQNNARFSMDLGGVFEHYASKRVLVRFDVGDTIISNTGAPTFLVGRPIYSGGTHNLQLGAGVAYRF
ncbi:MAG: outer membrane beta-barrel protein [Blastocatellia bacterium]|nr:outer membrane beta-barrel protein [Blastocatellia bacterium]